MNSDHEHYHSGRAGAGGTGRAFFTAEPGKKTRNLVVEFLGALAEDYLNPGAATLAAAWPFVPPDPDKPKMSAEAKRGLLKGKVGVLMQRSGMKGDIARAAGEGLVNLLDDEDLDRALIATKRREG